MVGGGAKSGIAGGEMGWAVVPCVGCAMDCRPYGLLAGDGVCLALLGRHRNHIRNDFHARLRLFQKFPLYTPRATLLYLLWTMVHPRLACRRQRGGGPFYVP